MGVRVREAKKRSTRSRLIETAFELFSGRGISATRTLEVARKAGVSHGTVFAHFPTKEQLIVEVIEEYGRRVVERIHERVERGAPVRRVLQAHLEGLAEYESFYARLVIEGPSLPFEARTALLGIQSAISFHLAEAAEAEMNEGAIKTMPIHLLFNTWLGLVHHYVVNRDWFAPGKPVLAARGAELLDHFMGLLRPQKY
jgi:AcrR family transcriptional regulator